MEGFKKFISQYKKNEVIYKTGDTQKNFYIINKGKVQLKDENKDLIYISLVKGDFFGEESLNENQSAAYTAEVMEDSDIIKIPYDSLKDMMKKNNNISLKILKKLSEKHIKTVENIKKYNQANVTPQKVDVQTEGGPEEEQTSELLDPDIKAYVVIERSNRVIQLTKTQTFIGRRDYTTGFVPDIDLTKEDEEKYISRKHSKISYINGRFYLSEEPGAVNGTFLNGTKLTTGVKHELADKDELTLCHLNLSFKF